jgi:soluble lytic murein transglycosylase-like protein/predicted negative regulator of RcsB-dependent stress response
MNIRKTSIAALVLLFSCNNAPISGNGLSTLGFYSPPETIITFLKDRQKGYHEHFLLGVAYKKENRYKEAIFHFANSCFKTRRDPKLRLFPQPVYLFVTGFHLKSVYYDDAVYELANLFAMYNEHAYAVKLADLVSESGTLLYRDSRLLMAKSLAAQQKYDESLTAMNKLLGQYDDPDSRALINLRIGSVMEKKGNYAGAIDSFLAVLAVDAKSWQAVSAAKYLVQNLEKNPRKLTVKQSLAFARALYFAKEYGGSISVLNSIQSETGVRREASALLIRSLVRNNEAKAADAIIRQNAGDASLHAVLLKTYADELWNAGKKINAVPAYQQVVKTGVEPHVREALQKTAQYLEERKITGYEQSLLDYAKKYSDDTAGHFLWLLGRNMIRAKNNGQALQYLEESIARFPKGSYSDECRFWLHKMHSQAGNKDKALKAALDIVVVNPDSPYAWLLLKQRAEQTAEPDLERDYRNALKEKNSGAALFHHALLLVKQRSLQKRTDRLGDLDSPDIERYRDLEKTIAGMKTSSVYGGVLKKIEKYFVIGHSAGITRELKTLPKTKQARTDKYIALAYYARKYRYAYLEVFSCLELLKLYDLKENMALMPEDMVSMLFPKPFEECVSRYGTLYAVEKNVIYAVMKAESLFKQTAVSSAGASGLMQLMPGTAKGIARGLKLERYDLNDPCTSIQLGTKYIAGLNREFKRNFQYMVASYNAGAGNVEKWKDKMQNEDMDYFTEFTPFIETRYYILRTDKFLTQYNVLYPGHNAGQ